MTSWQLNKNELVNEEVLQIKIENAEDKPAATAPPTAASSSSPQKEKKEDDKTEEDSGAPAALSGGTALDFNAHDDNLFVVGTDDGALLKYNKTHTAQPLFQYEGHQMAVYSVKWNAFHPSIFLTSSADWSVKLWEHGTKHPVMSWEWNEPVSHVAWAPYSSTVFAVAVNDGKVYVYDLSTQKHKEMACQPLADGAKPTFVAFNPHDPVLAVGDDLGNVTIYKLSTNLRKSLSDPHKNNFDLIDPLKQIDDLDKLVFIQQGTAVISLGDMQAGRPKLRLRHKGHLNAPSADALAAAATDSKDSKDKPPGDKNAPASPRRALSPRKGARPGSATKGLASVRKVPPTPSSRKS